MAAEDGEQRSIKSVETMARLLGALASARKGLTLSELSVDAGVSPSRAHAYAVGMIKARLIEHSPKDKTYSLGALARAVGTAAIAQHNTFDVVDNVAAELRSRTGLTVAVAVWHASGPVIVRWDSGSHPLPIKLSLGSTIPLTMSALGRVFLAWLPGELTQKKLLKELIYRDRSSAATQRSMYMAEADITRKQGFASTRATLFPEMCAVAAPILQDDHWVLSAIALLGTQDFRPVGGEKKIIKILLESTQGASRQLAGVHRAWKQP